MITYHDKEEAVSMYDTKLLACEYLQELYPNASLLQIHKEIHEMLHTIYNTPSYYFYLLFKDHKAIGFVVAYVSTGVESNLVIEHVYIRKDYRRTKNILALYYLCLELANKLEKAMVMYLLDTSVHRQLYKHIKTTKVSECHKASLEDVKEALKTKLMKIVKEPDYDYF